VSTLHGSEFPLESSRDGTPENRIHSVGCSVFLPDSYLHRNQYRGFGGTYPMNISFLIA
jgi:hypothetical protein